MSGCLLMGVGIWSLVEFFPYEPLSSSVHFAKASKLLIIAGLLNVLVSFFGCWAVSKENSRLFIFVSHFYLLYQKNATSKPWVMGSNPYQA